MFEPCTPLHSDPTWKAKMSPSSPRRVLTFTGSLREFRAYLDDLADLALTHAVARHPAGKGLRAPQDEEANWSGPCRHDGSNGNCAECRLAHWPVADGAAEERPAEVPHCGHYDTNVHQDRCCVCDQLTGSDDWSSCPGQRPAERVEGAIKLGANPAEGPDPFACPSCGRPDAQCLDGLPCEACR